MGEYARLEEEFRQRDEGDGARLFGGRARGSARDPRSDAAWAMVSAHPYGASWLVRPCMTGSGAYAGATMRFWTCRLTPPSH